MASIWGHQPINWYIPVALQPRYKTDITRQCNLSYTKGWGPENSAQASCSPADSEHPCHTLCTCDHHPGGRQLEPISLEHINNMTIPGRLQPLFLQASAKQKKKVQNIKKYLGCMASWKISTIVSQPHRWMYTHVLVDFTCWTPKPGNSDDT